MFTKHDSEKLRRKRSSIYFHAEATFVAAEDAATAYQAPSLIAAGAEARHVSTLSALLNLPIALLYVWLPSIMRRIGSRKKFILFLAILDTLGWLPLLAVIFFLRPATPFWLIALWVINLIPGVLLLPLRDSWLADIVPAGRIGRYLGIRTAVSSVAYLGTFFITGRLMDTFSEQIFKGFAIIFLVAFIATLIRAIIYYLIPDSDNGVENETEFGVGRFLQETRGQGLGKFILRISLFKFAVSLCSPLFAVYMVQNLKFSYTTFALVLSAEYVARVITAPLWGKYSDRVGNLPIVKRMSYLIPLIPILWLASPNPVYLVGVQLFSGTIWAGFDICSRSLVYTTSSPEKRAGYIAYKESLTALCQGLGVLAGAGILGFMIPVLGSKILGLFLLSGIARFVGAAAMPRIIRDEDDKTVPESRRLELLPRIPIGERKYTGSPSGQRLYSQLQGWLPHSKGSDSEVHPSKIRFTTAKPGDYYRPKDREDCSKLCPEEDAITKAYAEAVKSKRGLFFRPWDWEDYARQGASEATSIGRKGSENKNILREAYVKAVTSRRGLFYRPQDWGDYVRQQNVSKVPRKMDSKSVELKSRFSHEMRRASGLKGIRLCPATAGVVYR